VCLSRPPPSPVYCAGEAHDAAVTGLSTEGEGGTVRVRQQRTAVTVNAAAALPRHTCDSNRGRGGARSVRQQQTQRHIIGAKGNVHKPYATSPPPPPTPTPHTHFESPPLTLPLQRPPLAPPPLHVLTCSPAPVCCQGSPPLRPRHQSPQCDTVCCCPTWPLLLCVEGQGLRIKGLTVDGCC